MKLHVKQSLDDRGIVIEEARRYAEEIAASDLRELREQVAEAWTYAGECFATLARRHRFDDPDFALAVVERAMEGAFRRIWHEREHAALLLAHGWDDVPASAFDVEALLAYAEEWDADVAALREAVQEQEQEVER